MVTSSSVVWKPWRKKNTRNTQRLQLDNKTRLIMNATLLKKLYVAVEEWAQEHHVEPTFIEVKYTGLGYNVEIMIVAQQGLENWRAYERHDSLFNFIHARLNQKDGLGLTLLHIMTEDEYEKYVGHEASKHLASLWSQQRLSHSLLSKTP
jgi:hypothetical protein